MTLAYQMQEVGRHVEAPSIHNSGLGIERLQDVDDPRVAGSFYEEVLKKDSDEQGYMSPNFWVRACAFAFHERPCVLFLTITMPTPT